jgi:(+)-abscisic acid 8'-hydroxylase
MYQNQCFVKDVKFVLILVLIVLFRWEVVGNGDGIQYGPFPVPKHGLPVKITLKKN